MDFKGESIITISNTQQAEIDALTARVVTLEGKTSVLEGKVSTLESKVSALETTTATQATQISFLLTVSSNLVTAVTNLQAGIFAGRITQAGKETPVSITFQVNEVTLTTDPFYTFLTDHNVHMSPYYRTAATIYFFAQGNILSSVVPSFDFSLCDFDLTPFGPAVTVLATGGVASPFCVEAWLQIQALLGGNMATVRIFLRATVNGIVVAENRANALTLDYSVTDFMFLGKKDNGDGSMLREQAFVLCYN